MLGKESGQQIGEAFPFASQWSCGGFWLQDNARQLLSPSCSCSEPYNLSDGLESAGTGLKRGTRASGFISLDTLFSRNADSWKGTLQQYVGRLHRLDDG